MAEPPYDILIIDDNEDDTILYKRLLRMDPSIREVRSFETGADGIEAYKSSPCDCVLLDYLLPVANGCEVMDELRKLDKHLAIIMLTGLLSDEAEAVALSKGATDYIFKDKISARGLRRAVRNAIIKSGLERRLETQREAHDKLLMRLVHDMRAPLRHAASFAQFLGEDVGERRYEELAAYPDRIRNALNRATTMLDGVSAYAEVERDPQRAPVSAAAAVQAASSSLAGLIEARGASIDHADLPLLRASSKGLAEIFHQLIANAVMHNDAARPVVSVAAARMEGGGWCVSVTDNGPGIPADRRDEIFEPLQRLCSYDQVPGTGMGLAICRKIVEAHGGRIWCESEPGRGSAFHFTMPDIAEPPSAPSSSAAA